MILKENCKFPVNLCNGVSKKTNKEYFYLEILIASNVSKFVYLSSAEYELINLLLNK